MLRSEISEKLTRRLTVLLLRKKKDPKLLQILSPVCYASLTSSYPSFCRYTEVGDTFLKASRKTITINRIIQFCWSQIKITITVRIQNYIPNKIQFLVPAIFFLTPHHSPPTKTSPKKSNQKKPSSKQLLRLRMQEPPFPLQRPHCNLC